MSFLRVAYAALRVLMSKDRDASSPCVNCGKSECFQWKKYKWHRVLLGV